MKNVIKNIKQVTLVAILFLCVSSTNAQTKQTLIPIDDSYVFINKRNENYGSEKTLLVRRLPGKIHNVFLKFDVSKIKASTINKAVLRLYCVAIDNPSADTEVKLIAASSNDWKEAEITYGNAPKPTGRFLSSTLVVKKDNYYEWDITALLQKSKTDGVKELTVRLSDQKATGNGIQFSSKESDSNKPQLVIN